MRLHFTGTFPPAPRWQSSDNQTPLGQWSRPSAQTPGAHWPQASRSRVSHYFASSYARGHFHTAATHSPRQRCKSALLSPHARTHGVTGHPTTKRTRERASEKRSRRCPVPPGPAPTCRPRARGRRCRRPVLAKDEFEVELVVGATVCSSHRRGPRYYGSSSGGDYSSDSFSAPLHAGPSRPKGSGSGTNFSGATATLSVCSEL